MNTSPDPNASTRSSRWSSAWAEAATGPSGFWLSNRPANTFRTGLSDAPDLFATAVLERLGPTEELVDVGAGDGQLLRALRRREDGGPRLLTGVDVRPCPEELGALAGISWEQRSAAEWDRQAETIVLSEVFDEIPLDVAVRDGQGWRYVVVDEAGREAAGDPVGDADLEWLRRWAKDAERVEIGRPRDELVARLCQLCDRLLIIDYIVSLPGPTLLGYRAGSAVRPVPDGTMNLTAHVFLPSIAETARRAGLRTSSRTQRDVLRDLPRPPREEQGQAPRTAEEVREAALRQRLEDPAGPGGFAWVLLGR